MRPSPLASTSTATYQWSELPSSDGPSSPTTSSFYSRSFHSRPAHRQFKSTTSTRRNPSVHSSSSPPTSSLRTRTLENARMARTKTQKTRQLDDVGASGFEPELLSGWTSGGTNKLGMFEEYSEEEEAILSRRIERDAKRWMEEIQDKDDGLPLSEDEDDMQDGEDPPSDIEDLAPEAFSLTSAGMSLDRDPFEPPPYFDNDITMDHVITESLQPSSTPTADLAPAISHQFEVTLRSSICPACHTSPSTLILRETVFLCSNCEWRVARNALEMAATGWVEHAHVYTNASGHRPILSWTPFTGTDILCSACDEQFAL
ncbi:hypothetical protein T439DRAFT_323967 [Meredithblackwellia eburnea MCA 4105]